MKKAIITVCRNSAKTLERAFASVVHEIDQTKGEVNYIVIDGGSTDGTVDIIKKWYAKGLVKHYVSEADAGIYDAMNKGIKYASDEEYTVFLNSDDELYSGAFKALDEAYEQHPDVSYFYSDASIVDGDELRTQTAGYHKLAHSILCNHQALWVKAAMLKKLNGFDLSVGIAADSDLIYRLAADQGDGHYIKNHVLSKFHLGGVTSEQDHLHLNFLEVQWKNRDYLHSRFIAEQKFKYTYLHGYYKKLRRACRANNSKEIILLSQIFQYLTSSPRPKAPFFLLGLKSKFYQILSLIS